MLERRKEESEAMGKYQGLLVSAIIAAMIVFLAPLLIVSMMGITIGTDETPVDALVKPPDTFIPDTVTDRIGDLVNLVMWLVRIVLLVMIAMSLIMLRINPNQNRLPQ